MRIDRVRIAGIGPFRDEQLADFSAFAHDGLFLIAGRTGSGKSSILDAIVYALFDQMPRYDGGGVHRSIRSDHAEVGDASFVEVEFEVQSGRYRVTRAPEYERPKARGTGTTTSKPSASLEVFDDSADGDGAWVSLAARPSDVGEALSALLPLSRSQFMQVVLLAQNRFHEFLVADSKQRASLLRALFATQRFDGLADGVDARRRTAQNERDVAQARLESHRTRLHALSSQIDRVRVHLDAASAGAAQPSADTPSPASSREPVHAVVDRSRVASDSGDDGVSITELVERIASLDHDVEDLVAAASQRAEHAHEAFVQADARLSQATQLHERQGRQRAAQRSLSALLDAAGAIDVIRDELRDATTIAPLIPLMLVCDDAAAERVSAEARALETLAVDHALRDTNGERTAGGGTAGGDATGVLDDAGTPHSAGAIGAATDIAEIIHNAETRRDRALARLGTLRPALERERDRPAIAKALTEARSDLAADASALLQVRELLDAIPEQRRTLEAQRAEHEPAAGSLERTRRDLEAANAGLEAARGAEQVHSELARQTSALARADDNLRDVDERHSALLRARIENAAALLAAKLEPGEPCRVCGAVEHPAPASTESLGDVSDEAIAEAADQLDRAKQRRASAQRLVDEVSERWRAATSAAGGLGIAEHEQRVTDAAAGREAATTAVRARDAAAEGLTALDRELASAQTRQADLLQRQAAHADLVARRETDLASLDAQLAESRGGFPTVAAAIAAVEGLRDAATGTVSAMRDLQEARRRDDAARHDLDAALRSTEGIDLLDDVPPIGTPDWSARVEHVRTRARTARERTKLDARVRDHDDKLAGIRAQLEAPELVGLPDEPIDLDAATLARDTAVTARDVERARHAETTRLRSELADLATAVEHDGRGVAIALERYERLRMLADALRGQGSNELRMSLETYVLAAQMEEIVEAANERLAGMSSGRYRLQHDDSVAKQRGASGLGLVVFDGYTGRTRPTRSLSGGETFLASLALALGLSDTVTAQAGGVRLDTLFVDEGFGSLDAETLDDAMATLDSLRAGGRTVGVISHVEAMHEQIPARLELRVTERGDSIIEQEHP